MKSAADLEFAISVSLYCFVHYSSVRNLLNICKINLS